MSHALRDQRLAPGGAEHRLFEVARLSLRIFSNLVVFPMNPAGGTAKILTLTLKDALTRCADEPRRMVYLREYKQLFLWALVLGGLQADDDDEMTDKARSWFLARFIHFSSSAHVSTWVQVRDCLSEVLWSESVLTLAAWEFWKDAQTHGRMTTQR